MSDFNTRNVDELMAADVTAIDLSAEFAAIIELNRNLTEKTEELDDKIAVLLEERSIKAKPYLDAIQKHEDAIRNEIFKMGKPFKCNHGQAIYRKGSTSVKWNDDALIGYAVEHEEITQFRSVSVGKPSVVLKVGEQ